MVCGLRYNLFGLALARYFFDVGYQWNLDNGHPIVSTITAKHLHATMASLDNIYLLSPVANDRRKAAQILQATARSIETELSSFQGKLEAYEQRIQKAIVEATGPLIDALKQETSDLQISIEQYDRALEDAQNRNLCKLESKSGPTQSEHESGGPWAFSGEAQGNYTTKLNAMLKHSTSPAIPCSYAICSYWTWRYRRSPLPDIGTGEPAVDSYGAQTRDRSGLLAVGSPTSRG